MICKLCKKEKTLVESHIIPKYCFKYLYPDGQIEGKSLWVVDEDKGVEKRSRTGLYEKLLCDECDNMLGRFDDYAKGIFIDGRPDSYPGAEKQAYLFGNIDYSILKLFCLSVFWRASISSLAIFSKIDAGPYEDLLRNMLIKHNPGTWNEFPLFIAKYNAGRLGKIADKNIQEPVKTTIDGVNFALFFLPNGYQMYIKVDKRSLPDPFDKISLKNDGKLIVLCRGEFEKSDSFKALLKTINNLGM